MDKFWYQDYLHQSPFTKWCSKPTFEVTPSQRTFCTLMNNGVNWMLSLRIIHCWHFLPRYPCFLNTVCLRTLWVPSGIFDKHPLSLDNMLLVHILPPIIYFGYSTAYSQFHDTRHVEHYVIEWLCVPSAILNVCFDSRCSMMVLKSAWITLIYTNLMK